jgi:biopolymer transport protein ExbD
MLQRGVEVSLPEAIKAQEIESEPIYIDVPLSFGKDRRVFLGEEPVRLAVLPERVRQLTLNQTTKRVFLRIDRGLTVQHEIDVFVELMGAGIRQVGFVTDPPKQR